MKSITTTDFSKFGYRERKLAEQLLHAWNEQGLPEDFYEDEVSIIMNTHSGNVFLTNSDFQVAMMNGDKLESFILILRLEKKVLKRNFPKKPLKI